MSSNLNILSNIGKAFLLWRCTDCSDKKWNFHPWRFPKHRSRWSWVNVLWLNLPWAEGWTRWSTELQYPLWFPNDCMYFWNTLVYYVFFLVLSAEKKDLEESSSGSPSSQVLTLCKPFHQWIRLHIGPYPVRKKSFSFLSSYLSLHGFGVIIAMQRYCFSLCYSHKP